MEKLIYTREEKENEIIHSLNEGFKSNQLTVYGRVKFKMEELGEKESKKFLKDIKDAGFLDLIKIEKIMIDRFV